MDDEHPADSALPPLSHQSCRRCGTCCCKGGPALHLSDEPLVSAGKISLTQLFTIRAGEPVYENVRRIFEPAPGDIIKIKGAGDGSSDMTCRFFAHDSKGCRIYAHRPLECRLLDCRDTRAIVAVYAKDRLTRAHLIERVPGLVDLVGDHQQRCGYERIGALADMLKKGHDERDAVEALLEIIRYDYSLRQVTVERTRLDANLLDLLFGLPLTQTIRRLGLKLVKKGALTTIEPSGAL
jgi:Fe-S-cluster containining protein